MNLLASILPGMRDLRAPVAAGYVWLLNLWLLFGERIPDRQEATGILASLYDLEGVLSDIGLVVVLSFVAYLIGAVSHTLSAGFLQRIRYGSIIHRLIRKLPGSRGVGVSTWKSRLAYRRARFFNSLSSASSTYARYLKPRVAALLEEIGTQDPTVLDNDVDTDNWFLDSLNSSIVERQIIELARRKSRGDVPNGEAPVSPEPPHETRDGDRVNYKFVPDDDDQSFDAITDLDLVRPRLMSEQSTLYGEYDRLQSEAEFRVAIALPLAFLSLILAVQERWFWLAALLPLSVLVIEGVRRQNRADLTLVAAVYSGKVKSPLLENLERALEAARHQMEVGPREADGGSAPTAATTRETTPKATTA